MSESHILLLFVSPKNSIRKSPAQALKQWCYCLVHVTLPCKVKVTHLYSNELHLVSSCFWPWHSRSLALLVSLHPFWLLRGVFFVDFFGGGTVLYLSSQRNAGMGAVSMATHFRQRQYPCCAFLYLLLRLPLCERCWSLQHTVNMHTNHQSSSSYEERGAGVHVCVHLCVCVCEWLLANRLKVIRAEVDESYWRSWMSTFLSRNLQKLEQDHLYDLSLCKHILYCVILRLDEKILIYSNNMLRLFCKNVMTESKRS